MSGLNVEPTLSIVMPVYETGRLVIDSVRSIVQQTLLIEEGDGYWELLIVDDGSIDADTLEALAEAERMSTSIRVMSNRRAKGPAGARNTGVFAARGAWIGFLDSDDLWYPDFLRRQRDAFLPFPEARWRAAHFDVGDDMARATPMPLKERSPCLFRHVERDYLQGLVSKLDQPVGILLQCGCMQVMTVQVARDLIHSVGGFDEHQAGAEDYDLWLRLANRESLFIAPLDAGIYRLRKGSLTKSDRPMYYCEDRMLLSARSDTNFASHAAEIDARLRKVYSTFCFHYRMQGRFAIAGLYARKLIRLAPRKLDGWRHFVAATLRR